MHQHAVAFDHHQRPRLQPVQQRVAIRRGEYRVKRVAAMLSAVPGRHRQQVEVMVAQNRRCGVTQRHHIVQNFERAWPAIDEITDQPQPVLACRKADQREQFAEFRMTSLDITDCVERHPGMVRE